MERANGWGSDTCRGPTPTIGRRGGPHPGPSDSCNLAGPCARVRYRCSRARSRPATAAAGMLLAGCGSDAHGRAVPGGRPDRDKLEIAAYGCGACHVIPGVGGAYGSVGPPLTKFARRVYIAGEGAQHEQIPGAVDHCPAVDRAQHGDAEPGCHRGASPGHCRLSVHPSLIAWAPAGTSPAGPVPHGARSASLAADLEGSECSRSSSSP